MGKIPKKNNKKHESDVEAFFQEFPLLRNFKMGTKEDSFIFEDAYGKTPNLHHQTELIRFLCDYDEVDSMSTEFNKITGLPALKKICQLPLEKFLKEVLPNEPKFIKLMMTSVSSLMNLFKTYQFIAEAAYLIRQKHNKDIVFNHLDAVIKGLSQNASISYAYPPKLLNFLTKHYSTQRVCKLVFNLDRTEPFRWDTPASTMLSRDTLESVIYLKRMGVDVKSVLPDSPKSVLGIHNALYARLQYELNFVQLKDYELNPREDFLKLDGKTIVVNQENLKVVIPKTRKELAEFSRKNMFDNCVGTSDTYAEGCRNGKWTIIGIFTENNSPRYCIQATSYSFIQAKGISNSSIPKDISLELQNLLTKKPEIPEDFIRVEKSAFLSGYKYDPENQKFYLLFGKKHTIYEYEGISHETYEEFSHSKNKGEFFQQNIRNGNYPYARIN